MVLFGTENIKGNFFFFFIKNPFRLYCLYELSFHAVNLVDYSDSFEM